MNLNPLTHHKNSKTMGNYGAANTGSNSQVKIEEDSQQPKNKGAEAQSVL